MMKAIRISPKVWWVGAIDWQLKEFHGYTTRRGSTYNAFLIIIPLCYPTLLAIIYPITSLIIIPNSIFTALTVLSAFFIVHCI